MKKIKTLYIKEENGETTQADIAVNAENIDWENSDVFITEKDIDRLFEI